MANIKELVCYLPSFQNPKYLCRKKFKSSAGLANHQSKSHGRKQSWEEESLEFSEENKRPFNCKLCEKTFIHKYDAKCHVEKVHEIKNLNKNPYKCKLCPEDFSLKIELKDHIKSVHEKVVRIECSVEKCDETFLYKAEIRRHIKKFHVDHKPHKCQFCEKAFATSIHKTNHETLVHNTGCSFS